MSTERSIKVGDIVHVRARVTNIAGLFPKVAFKEDEAMVGDEEIIHVEPRPIKVGDRVRNGGDDTEYVVLAISDDRAWIKHNTYLWKTVLLANLTRIDGDPS